MLPGDGRTILQRKCVSKRVAADNNTDVLHTHTSRCNRKRHDVSRFNLQKRARDGQLTAPELPRRPAAAILE